MCGDAWLPEFTADSRGTNVVVVRDRALLSLLERAQEESRIHLEALPIERVFESQAGGFRHRRDGLAYRLWQADKAGLWRPPKRVAPAWKHLNRKMRRIFRMRFELSEVSHRAFASAKEHRDFGVFLRVMTPLVRRYDREYTPNILIRGIRKFARILTSYRSKE